MIALRIPVALPVVRVHRDDAGVLLPDVGRATRPGAVLLGVDAVAGAVDGERIGRCLRAVARRISDPHGRPISARDLLDDRASGAGFPVRTRPGGCRHPVVAHGHKQRRSSATRSALTATSRASRLRTAASATTCRATSSRRDAVTVYAALGRAADVAEQAIRPACAVHGATQTLIIATAAGAQPPAWRWLGDGGASQQRQHNPHELSHWPRLPSARGAMPSGGIEYL